jgi:hypothetical protein
MPLTEKGLKALKQFKAEYGSILGRGIFYKYMAAHPKRTKLWHRR